MYADQALAAATTTHNDDDDDDDDDDDCDDECTVCVIKKFVSVCTCPDTYRRGNVDGYKAPQ